jgi:RNA polymerase sigma-70 factor, ECF subfamily
MKRAGSWNSEPSAISRPFSAGTVLTAFLAEFFSSNETNADWDLLDAAKAARGQKATENASRLVALLRPKAFSLAYRLLQDRGLAEDAVQEAFIRLWKSAAVNTGQARLSTYFHRIVFNEAMRISERFKREDTVEHHALNGLIEAQQLINEDQAVEWVSTPGAAPEQIEAAIALLPQRQRAALLLWAYEDLSIKEIAVALELQENAAHQLVYRAKHALKKHLEARS